MALTTISALDHAGVEKAFYVNRDLITSIITTEGDTYRRKEGQSSPMTVRVYKIHISFGGAEDSELVLYYATQEDRDISLERLTIGY
jgi:predicted aspartyl protease